MTVRQLASVLVFLAVVAAAPPAEAQSFWQRARAAAQETIQAGVNAVKKDVQRRSSSAINGLLGDSTDTASPTGALEGEAFMPGSVVLFATDDVGGDAGTVPDGLHIWGGDIALADEPHGLAIVVAESGAFDVVLDDVMPESFTVEFDLLAEGAVPFIQISVANDSGEPAGGSYLIVDGESGMALGSDSGGDYVAEEIVGAAEIPVRLAVAGSDASLYLGDTLVATAADADFGQDVRLQIVVDNIQDVPVYLSGLRVATD
ncbi:MAG: hypothetical protein Rubg2KO_13570 [Rubricoccaceae bacterium]